MVNSNALPRKFAKNSTQRSRWQRTLAKIILGSHLQRVTQDNICNSLTFLQLPPSAYYFLFLRRDGWLPIYTKQFVPSAPPVFSFAAFAIISNTSTWKSKKWCLTTCHVDITWKLYSLDFINVLCPSYEAPFAPFQNVHQVKSSLCLPLSHSSEFLQNPPFHFFWRLGPESCCSTICLANV